MARKIRISGIVVEYLEADEMSVENAQEIADELSSKLNTRFGVGSATVVSRVSAEDIEEIV